MDILEKQQYQNTIDNLTKRITNLEELLDFCSDERSSYNDLKKKYKKLKKNYRELERKVNTLLLFINNMKKEDTLFVPGNMQASSCKEAREALYNRLISKIKEARDREDD